MKFLTTILILIISIPVFSNTNDFENKFQEANKLYNQNKFEEALNLYKEIISGSYSSEDLFYNSGNAAYRLNKLGDCIYFYEKALQINPNNEDCRYNLELANLRVKEKPEVIPKTSILAIFEKIVWLMSGKFWAYLSIALFITFLITFYVYVKSHTVLRKKIYFLISILLFFFSITSIIFTKYQRSTINSDSTAIIISKEIQAKSSPDEAATNLFPVYEGYKIEVENISGNWCEIRLTDGKKAWIEKINIKQL